MHFEIQELQNREITFARKAQRNCMQLHDVAATRAVRVKSSQAELDSLGEFSHFTRCSVVGCSFLYNLQIHN